MKGIKMLYTIGKIIAVTYDKKLAIGAKMLYTIEDDEGKIIAVTYDKKLATTLNEKINGFEFTREIYLLKNASELKNKEKEIS